MPDVLKMSGTWTCSYHFVKVSWDSDGVVILEFTKKIPGVLGADILIVGERDAQKLRKGLEMGEIIMAFRFLLADTLFKGDD